MLFESTGYYTAHKPVKFEFSPGYTPLLGPNGAGKTSLLLELQEYAKENDIICILYSNLTDGGPQAGGKAIYGGNVQLGASLLVSSEGESISINFGQVVNKIGRATREGIEQGKPVFILLDALDSGTSIDRIREIRDLFNLISRDCEKRGGEVYIFAACNAYEMVRGAEGVDVRTGKQQSFADYNAYSDFICKHPIAVKKG